MHRRRLRSLNNAFDFRILVLSIKNRSKAIYDQRNSEFRNSQFKPGKPTTTSISDCFFFQSCSGRCPCPGDEANLDLGVLNKCTCETEFKPVCGHNGETYGNECYAGCKEVHIDCDGRCPCPPRLIGGRAVKRRQYAFLK